MVKRKRKLGGNQQAGGSGGLSPEEKKKKIDNLLVQFPWLSRNEAKRRLHLKGVHPRKKHRQRTKHTVQVHQPGEHRGGKK